MNYTTLLYLSIFQIVKIFYHLYVSFSYRESKYRMNKNKVGHFKKMICVGKESSDVKASISIIELSEQDRVNNL